MSSVSAIGALTQPGPVTGTPTAPVVDVTKGPAFGELLRRQTGGVQFSKHALERIERRGIDMGADKIQRLENGIERAAQKGARDSVIFLDGTAFVVGVEKKTVITAVDPGHMREHVFTNIDSAVIA